MRVNNVSSLFFPNLFLHEILGIPFVKLAIKYISPLGNFFV